MRIVRYLLPLGLTLAISPVAAQDRKPASPPRADDIVVEGLLVPGEKPPTAVVPGTTFGVKNRVAYENSQRVAKCAMRTPLPALRETIDGAPNSSLQRQAQAWLIRRTATCNADPTILARQSAGGSMTLGLTTNAFMAPTMETQGFATSELSVLEQSADGSLIYDRGALLEQVLDTYAPDLSLTKEQTGDPVVQGRFNLRESPRNGYRQKADLEYFRVAVCMVRMQPKLAIGLYRAKPGSGRQGRIQSALINNARVCVGNARKVYVDATQFRIYVMDALYRWVLAARDVPSLIPPPVVAGTESDHGMPS